MSYDDRGRNETVVVTDRGSGSGGVLAGVLVALAVIAGLFFFFGGDLFSGRSGAGGDTHVSVNLPPVNAPNPATPVTQ